MLLPVTGIPAIEQVDSAIFTLRMHGTCMTCTYCGDSCCQYGCDVNLGERDRILAEAAALQPYVKSPVAQWFKPEVFEDPEYPTGKYVRANTAGKGCVFMSPDGRGCAIHRYALKTGRDYHDLKPMVCWLFPVCWDKQVLRPSHDVRDDLVCKGKGMTLYEVTREEVLHVFGEALVSQLDRHRDAVLATQPRSPRPAPTSTASIRSVAPGL